MSSSSSVCKGLQSCLEPLILEHLVLTHSSFFASSLKQSENYYAENQKESCDIRENCEPNKNGENSWNFLQAITNISYNSEQVYVHPLVKRSTLSMSPRSLEMCTESLGSENGSSFYSSFDEISYLVLEKQSCTRKTQEKCEKIKHNGFPPPLTSISGNNGVKMQRNYEGGRLVIKAVDSSSCGAYFKAERENGRLRLSLMKENEEVGVKNIGGEAENETDVKRRLWAEKVKIKGGDWSSSSRCNGDGSKRLPSLPFCVAIS